MKKLSFSCSLGSSDIYIGNLKTSLAEMTEVSNLALIVSSQVATLHPWLLNTRLFHVIQDDGQVKSLKRAEELYGRFLSWKLDRTSVVAAVGGGAICDLVGFVASTFMRGLPFLLIPTTLLAQADAAVGGKTALDWDGIKNVIGTFALPQATLVDPEFLRTLPLPEILNGLAEIVKHALIGSPELFSFLQANWSRLLQPDLEMMAQVIMDSIKIKISFVVADARDTKERRLLNFGHTLAHAVEKEKGWSHGQAVVWGMALATKISERLGYLKEGEADEIVGFLKQNFSFFPASHFSLPEIDKIFECLEADKKRESEIIHFVVLHRLGKAGIHRLNLRDLKEIIHDLC